MSSPTTAQISQMGSIVGNGSYQSNGSYLNGTVPFYDHPLYLCIEATRLEFGIAMNDAIDFYSAFLMWNDMIGGTLVPDSSSNDSILAFVGRCREIYADQNP